MHSLSLKCRQNQNSNTAYYNYHMNECLNGKYYIKSSIGKVESCRCP